MTNYRKGATFERKVKKQYEAEGYIVVRAAGSKGPIDLVAIDPTDPCPDCGNNWVELIQCKTRKPTAAEKRAAKETGLPILLVWPDGKEWA